MSFKSTSVFIHAIEQDGELIRIKTKVNPYLEIAELADRQSKQPGGGKALLFENTGTEFPVLINALGSDKRILKALNVSDYDDIAKEITDLLKDITGPKKNLFEKLKVLPELKKIASYIPKTKSGRGACQEIVMSDPDLTKLPVLTTWNRDGGPFITFPQVITKDPITGIRNVGMYRMQVLDKTTTGMHWHKHKTGERHFSEYKKLGQRMPVAVALGGDPALTYAATAPLPDNIDEYMLAGFLRKKKVELVKCLTQDIYVPADADFIIEGYVDPTEDKIWEGPFGDHTGFFSLADWYPKFHVTCISHRRNAVYPATVVGVPPMEDVYIAKATERIFLAPIQLTMVPEIHDMDLPIAGVAHNISIASIEKTFPGQALKAMNSLWGAGQMMFNKIQILTDKTTDVHDYMQVAQTVSAHCEPFYDIQFLRGPMDVLDHSSSKFAFGSKLGIDATQKYAEELAENRSEMSYSSLNINVENILAKYPEIKIINANLLKKNISAVLISVEKSKEFQLKELSEKLFAEPDFSKIKFIGFVDFPADANNVDLCVWLIAGNLEPLRDCFVFEAKSENEVSHIALDGTRKRADIDNFKRDWPDIVTADNNTIELVNKRWAEYEIGAFIESPSQRLKHLALSETAIVV